MNTLKVAPFFALPVALAVAALGCAPAPSGTGDEGTDEGGEEEDSEDEEEDGEDDTTGDENEEEETTDDEQPSSSTSTSSTSSPSTSGDTSTSSTTQSAEEGDDVVADEGPVGNCTFTVTPTVSSAIATVGIVEWSVDLPSVDGASIEFGLDTNYGMTAPVDLAEPNYRTLLLGMKGGQEYHFRVRASGGGTECQSEDFTLETGLVPNALPRPTFSTPNPAGLAGGFFVSGFYQGQGPGGAYAFILDVDGEFVWYFSDSQGLNSVTSVKMTYDGNSMWMRNDNVSTAPNGGAVVRVSMDGLEIERAEGLNATHHDFAVLPDGTLGLLAYGEGCDVVLERAPDGTVREIFNLQDAHGSTTCHTNSIHYHPDDDTYTVSDLGGGAFGGGGANNDIYVKFTRAGEIVWVLGGSPSDFTGDGADWSRQHGHHLFSADRLLFFNNREANQSALAVELQLDLTQMTATEVWRYDGNIPDAVMGDVQRLDNGNTLVTYSVAGTVHEVDASGALVQEFSWLAGATLGYATKRSTLYGPPPR